MNWIDPEKLCKKCKNRLLYCRCDFAKINLTELIEKLKKIDSGDEEWDHIYADRLLLNYIGDKRVEEAFEIIKKWYA